VRDSPNLKDFFYSYALYIGFNIEYLSNYILGYIANYIPKVWG